MGNYYRYRSPIAFGGFTLTPVVKYLLIINAVLYVGPKIFQARELYEVLPLALAPAQVIGRLYIWQVFTYMFFHFGFSHFLFNMLTLWMFGTAVEQTWGTRRFTSYYLSCGLAAGITVVVAALASGSPRALYSPTIGSSGAIFGLILAFGLLFPDAPVLMMFLFPVPAKYFAILMGCIEFFLQRVQPGSSVSHVAHLGGMVYGLLYIKYFSRRRRAEAHYWYARPAAHSRRRLFDFDLRGAYQRWKLRRARKEFEVYMREHEEAHRQREDSDRWVH